MFSPKVDAVDCYCHFGLPRFGSEAQVRMYMQQYGVSHAITVLGPQVPDYELMMTFLRVHRENVRCVGIPFGDTAAEMEEVVELQLTAGVLGIRLDPSELSVAPGLLDLIGERGRCAFAINPCKEASLVRTYLRWMQRYPSARVVAPHFLGLTAEGLSSDTIQLLNHPRFYPVLSRQSAFSVKNRYPYSDLRSALELVLEHVDQRRILWGSEFPVLLWRNESVPEAMAWMADLMSEVGMSMDLDAFYAQLRENALREFFSEPPAPYVPVIYPTWVAQRFLRDRTIPIFQHGLDVHPDVFQSMLSRYLQNEAANRIGSFARLSDTVLEPFRSSIE